MSSDEMLETKLNFGRWKGQTIATLLTTRQGREYLNWCVNNILNKPVYVQRFKYALNTTITDKSKKYRINPIVMKCAVENNAPRKRKTLGKIQKLPKVTALDYNNSTNHINGDDVTELFDF